MQEPDSFPEGRLKAGLHKRSAEDKGGSCARQGRSPSGRPGFDIARFAADLLWGRYGVSPLGWGVSETGPVVLAGPGWELGKGTAFPV